MWPRAQNWKIILFTPPNLGLQTFYASGDPTNNLHNPPESTNSWSAESTMRSTVYKPCSNQRWSKLFHSRLQSFFPLQHLTLPNFPHPGVSILWIHGSNTMCPGNERSWFTLDHGTSGILHTSSINFLWSSIPSDLAIHWHMSSYADDHNVLWPLELWEISNPNKIIPPN